MDDIHFMCAADIHLGRHAGPHRMGTPYVVQAWERLINICLDPERPVDGLLLAGDLIDRRGLFIEMHGLLRRGVRQLLERGIAVIAVAGNHDAEVLRQFNESLGFSGFCLLGSEGQWERKTLLIRGRAVHIDGFSFSKSKYMENPLEGRVWEPVPEDEVLIGLLHCDVDNPRSIYAPVRSADFQGLPHQAWILGHIHAPRTILPSCPWVQYCGSLQGLDVAEAGRRGAWRMTVPARGEVVYQQIPLAPLRWEWLVVDVSDLLAVDWEKQLLKKIEAGIAERCQEGGEAVDLIGVRLQLRGTTEAYRSLREEIGRFLEQEVADCQIGERWVAYFIESVKNDTRPPVDLVSLSKGRNIVGAIAKKLLAVQEGKADLGPSLRARIGEEPFFRQWGREWPEIGEAELRDLYLSQGYQLLDELLGQRLCD